ncbi:MAG: isochorismatase family protein, partial [Burkholderiales bacterium]
MLSIKDSVVYRRQGFGNAIGLGRRPALLIVDFTVGFADPAGFGGGNIRRAIGRTIGLLAFFRVRRLPVAFSRIVYADDGSDVGVFATKVPTLATLTEANPRSHIVPALAPMRGELVVRKTEPSAFFSTGLA